MRDLRTRDKQASISSWCLRSLSWSSTFLSTKTLFSNFKQVIVVALGPSNILPPADEYSNEHYFLPRLLILFTQQFRYVSLFPTFPWIYSHWMRVSIEIVCFTIPFTPYPWGIPKCLNTQVSKCPYPQAMFFILKDIIICICSSMIVSKFINSNVCKTSIRNNYAT